MNIKTWRERYKPGIRAATDPTIAELMQAEIDELRAALKAQPVQEPVGEVAPYPEVVNWYKEPAIGAKLYAVSVQPVQPALNIDAAAKLLAERMDYPWDYMPMQGRDTMREHAKAIIEAALRTGGAG